MRKAISLLLAMALMLAPVAIYAEGEDEEAEQTVTIDDVEEEDRPVDDDEQVVVADTEDSGPPSIKGKKALYRTKIKMPTAAGRFVTIRYARDTNSESLGTINAGKTVTLYEIDPSFALVEYEGKVGYILRSCIDENCETLDPANTLPYGVQQCKYVATTTQKTEIYQTKNTNGPFNDIVVGENCPIAILGFEDGFAKVIYWRTYGYIPANRLTDLEMVSTTEEPMSAETPIAAFTSFFEYGKGTDMNTGRVKNIMRSCESMTRIMQPGDEVDFNKDIGPWKKSNGYFPAPVLIDGGSQAGFGGGTCQSSSTMYNTIRQLPKITILYRRPHGPKCARYLPQHQDAAVGNSSLNLIYRNDYDFPLRFEAICSGLGALTIKIYKVQ